MKKNQGTHIFNIDGTLVKYHTNEWLSGAKEYLIKLFSEGNKLVLITPRNTRDENQVWSIENTTNTILSELDDLNIDYIVLFDIPIGRTIHENNLIIDERSMNESYGGKILNGNKYVDLWAKGQPIDYKNII